MSMQRVGFVLGVLAIFGCSKAPAPPENGRKSTVATVPSTGSETAGGEASGSGSPTSTPVGAASVARLPLAAIFVLPAATSPTDRLSLDEIRAFLDDPQNHEPILPEVPLGLLDLASVVPADNQITRAKVELGRMLYFDPRLSRDSTVSCATCHDPSKGWAQDTPVATGIGEQKGGRNSPTVMNRAFGRTQFWDGRAASLEEQALGPIQNPIEMGFTLNELVERLKVIEGYQLFFSKIYGDVTPEAIGKSIATFERMVLVGASPFDYFEAADKYRKLTPEDLEADAALAAAAKAAIEAAEAHPLSDSAQRGRALFFGKAQCSVCHVGSNLADEAFYNIGVGMDKPSPDMGRREPSKDEKDTGAFKTPTVRNVALTAPYMHDGSEKTLMEVVEYYDKGGNSNPHLHPRIKKLSLTAQEKEDLVAFLRDGLTGQMPDIKPVKLP